MQFIGAHVPDNDANHLRQLAHQNERTLAAELRLAIREYGERRGLNIARTEGTVSDVGGSA